MTRKYLYVFLLLPFLLPFQARAAISITEVAWMGTASSQFSEWIELFNDGEAEVNLNGFTLLEGTSTVLFTLTKKIAPGGYYLVERTTASSPDAILGVDDDAGTWGGGGLSNSGERLVLKDANGQAVFDLSAAAGWPAGDATSKETMQWSGSSWVTAVATPRSITVATASSGGSSTGGSASSSGSSSRATVVNSNSSHSSPVPLSSADLDRPVISLDAGRNRFALAGSPVRFVALAKKDGDPLVSPTYEWSFGDGSSVTDSAPSHIYEFPGTYHVVLNVSDAADSSVARTLVRVEDSSFLSIAQRNFGDQSFEILNSNGTEANIGGFVVSNGKESFRFPLDTILEEKEKIIIPYTVTKLSNVPGTTLTLLRPDGKKVGETSLLSAPVSSEAQPSTTLSGIEKVKLDLVRAESQLKQLSAAKRPVVSKPRGAVASAQQAAVPVGIMATSAPEEIIISVPKPPGAAGAFSRLWQRLFGPSK